MAPHNFNELQAFIAASRKGNFTRAAVHLGIIQSALSQTVSNLETRLQIRLLMRTTRSVSLTAAGESLLDIIGQRFDKIESRQDSLTQLREKPAGTVLITSRDFTVKKILLPKLTPLLLEYPDIKLEFSINYDFVAIVAKQFDAGIHFGETVD